MNWKSNSARTNRSAKRIPLQVLLTVTGRDEHGTAFADPVRTENISIDGGCLLFNRDLRRNQSFKIEGLNGACFVARVRWCMYYFRQDITRRVSIGYSLQEELGIEQTGCVVSSLLVSDLLFNADSKTVP